jgi:hypothetical protein
MTGDYKSYNSKALLTGLTSPLLFVLCKMKMGRGSPIKKAQAQSVSQLYSQAIMTPAFEAMVYSLFLRVIASCS